MTCKMFEENSGGVAGMSTEAATDSGVTFCVWLSPRPYNDILYGIRETNPKIHRQSTFYKCDFYQLRFRVFFQGF